jgi:hypothetical protein
MDLYYLIFGSSPFNEIFTIAVDWKQKIMLITTVFMPQQKHRGHIQGVPGSLFLTLLEICRVGGRVKVNMTITPCYDLFSQVSMVTCRPQLSNTGRGPRRSRALSLRTLGSLVLKHRYYNSFYLVSNILERFC